MIIKVNLTPQTQTDYEESYGSYNRSGGESYQMRTKGS